MARPTLDLIRASAALVHSTRGAWLRIVSDTGATVVVSPHPEGDVTPCQFRKVVSAHATGQGPDMMPHISGVTVGGSLRPLGAGLHAFGENGAGCDENAEIRFTSLLGPMLTEQVLSGVGTDKCAVEATRTQGASANLSVDRVLGVVVVALTHTEPEWLHEIAVTAAAAIATEEAVAHSTRVGSR